MVLMILSDKFVYGFVRYKTRIKGELIAHVTDEVPSEDQLILGVAHQVYMLTNLAPILRYGIICGLFSNRLRFYLVY